MSGPDPQRGERAHRLMMAALDGEISDRDRAELDRLLRADSALEVEWRELARLKEVTSSMALRKPPDEVWDRYWGGVYRRLERGIGWILTSLGAIVLISYGVWKSVEDLLADATLPAAVKVAVLALIVGVIVLLVSVIREKLFVRRSDPYKDVIR